MSMQYKKQPAAASLFVVIFTALIVTVVTVSFAQAMLRNQEQSVAADLSQSAYDSAMAGVEDAKRLLILAANCDASGNSSPACTTAKAAIAANNCTTTIDGLALQKVAGTEAEVQVGPVAMNQAYTCIKIENASKSYTVSLNAGQSKLMVLQPVGGAISSVRFTWHTPPPPQSVTIPNQATLPQLSAWPSSAQNPPPVLRALYAAGDTNNDDTTSSQTMIAMPRTAGGIAYKDQTRRDGNFLLSNARCVTQLNNAYGICTIVLDLKNQLAVGSKGYIQLATYYQQLATSITVEPLDSGGQPTAIAGYPIVDATGRAVDQFRRVKAQVRVGADANSDAPFPRAALDIQGPLCKTFFLTDNSTDYASGACDPAS